MNFMAVSIAILKLAIMILKSYLEKMKRAREAQEKYDMDMDKFEQMASAAVAKLRADIAADSKKAATMDDAMDEHIRNSSNNSKEE